jgi:chitinase
MRKFAVYYTTWNATWVSKKEDLDLYNLKKKYPDLNCVYISFAKPDLTYRKGSFSWVGTGLEFSMDFSIVKESISYLKSLGVIVMIAFGGGTYWSANEIFKCSDAVNLIEDLGADGADLDYETAELGLKLTEAVQNLRPLMGSKFISIAAFSTGAFDYKHDGSYNGINVHTLTFAGKFINWINLMAYDAGGLDMYDPIEAIKAYRKLFKRGINLGFLIGQPSWGGYLLTREDLNRNATFAAIEDKNNGGFIWADKKIGAYNDNAVFKDFSTIFKSKTVDTIDILPPVKLEIKCPVCKTTFTK